MPESQDVKAEETVPPSTRWKWLLLFLAFLGCLGPAFLFLTRSEASFPIDSTLVRTTYPTGGVPANTGLISRLTYEFFEYRRRRHPNPLNWSFPVSATNRCSVHGLLNQCMEVTGMEYVIDKNVAAGSVNFGSDHVQNGAEWVHSFEQTVLHDAEWWDPDRQGFRHERIVLLRYGHRTTLVVPESVAKRLEREYPAMKRVPVSR